MTRLRFVMPLLAVSAWGQCDLGSFKHSDGMTYICEKGTWESIGTWEPLPTQTEVDSLKTLKAIEKNEDFNSYILVCGFFVLELMLLFIWMDVRK